MAHGGASILLGPSTKEITMSFDVTDFILRFECDELEDESELIRGFQYLIDSGLAWTLQGSYGRSAAALIDAGLCTAR